MLWRLRRLARDADFITLHSVYSFPVLAGYLLARHYHKPYGLWPDGVLLPVQRKIGARKKRIYDWLFASRILQRASVLFFSGADERKEALKLGLTPPMVLIPHGFDGLDFERLPPRGNFRAKYLDGHKGPLVLYLSRLNAKKGLDLVAEAFALVIRQAPNARLAIVGSGDPPAFESQVRDWLHRCGVERWSVMTGLLTGRQKLEAFADADVFVLPSEGENFGFAMFEAMASCIPVVVSNTLDYAGEVQRVEAGLVVRRDAKEFANGMVRLLQNAELRQRMGKNGLLMTRAFTWEKCGDSIERTLTCVLQGKSPPADLTCRQPSQNSGVS
jgi:glycosyltransferase involved in cell wall biosynthesis